MEIVTSLLKKLNFEPKIIYPVKESDKVCDYCREIIYSHIVCLDCKHICCTQCLDILTDNYDSDNVSILFTCPLCTKNIKNIDYI